jgi:(p)ppGpp synthase/HD superfamily hydrolase
MWANMVSDAELFARYAHGTTGVVRRYSNTPYIIHPQDVASTLATFDMGPKLVAAGWLHDTVEDVDWVTDALIRQRYGEEVANHVRDVTKTTTAADGTRAWRLDVELQRLRGIPPSSQTLKTADVLSNIRGLEGQNDKFARRGIQEKAHALMALSRAYYPLRYAALDELHRIAAQMQMHREVEDILSSYSGA